MSDEKGHGSPGEYVECKTGMQCVCTHERCGYIPWSAAYDETRDVEALAEVIDREPVGCPCVIPPRPAR